MTEKLRSGWVSAGFLQAWEVMHNGYDPDFALRIAKNYLANWHSLIDAIAWAKKSRNCK